MAHNSVDPGALPPMTQPSSPARTRSAARRRAHWVSETTDERLAGVRHVEVVLQAGRIEIGRRPRDARVRTTIAVTGWRARLAAMREPGGVTVRRSGDTGDTVHIAGGSGQVRVRLDVTDDATVTARIAEGDITLWGVGADLELSVGRGTLAARELTGTVVRADNDDGEVNLHFVAAPAEVEAHARGAAVLVLPAGRYVVDGGAGAEVTVEHAADAAARIVIRGTTRTAVLAATGSEPI
ncbi:MAG: hypothetical protein QOJ32_796 [Frankiaceae bacterium]|nr:hypothetical protein [Frankiaceae bacterium]